MSQARRGSPRTYKIWSASVKVPRGECNQICYDKNFLSILQILLFLDKVYGDKQGPDRGRLELWVSVSTELSVYSFVQIPHVMNRFQRITQILS